MNLRKFSFFRLHPKIPASVICYIFYLFIILGINADKITKEILHKFGKGLSYQTILSILMNIRKCIDNYLKKKLRAIQIGGDPTTNTTVALVESLFIHDNGDKIWVIGAKETKSSKLRIDIMKERTEANLKKFVVNHIEPGTKITHDDWSSYSFLDDDDSVWDHEIHIQGGRDFGFGDSSTSHIESTWANLKSKIKNIYNIIPHQNFIYFLREAEFRINISKKSDTKKQQIFTQVLKEVYLLNHYKFYDDNQIIDFNNYI